MIDGPLPSFDDVPFPEAVEDEQPGVARKSRPPATTLFGFTEAQIEAERQRTVASNARHRRIAEALDLADENLPAIVGELSELNEVQYGLRRKALAESFTVTVGNLDKIYRHIQRADEKPPEAGGREVLLVKDYAFADVLAPLFSGRFRWAAHRERWMRRRGPVWEPTEEGAVAKIAADELRVHFASLLAEARDKSTLEHFTRLLLDTCSYVRIAGGLAFLKGWPDILTRAEEWDADGWELNCANCVLDLRTMEPREHADRDLFTKLAPVDFDPEAGGEAWRAHIERVQPNANVRRQIQRALGVALVGATLEESLDIWYGGGANAKSTTAKVILAVLGEYGMKAAPNLLIQTKHEEHPAKIADLVARRLVFSVEIDQGKRLAEAVAKELTGGDRLKARFMRQDFFEFHPTHSITLIVNYRPVVGGTDEAIWRRIRLIPWDYVVPEEERRPQDEMVAELVADGSAILAWLLAGLADWKQDQRWKAPEVTAATATYRSDQDMLGDFLTDDCELGPGFRILVGALWTAYAAWCDRSARDPMTKKAFGQRLGDHGLTQDRRGPKGVRRWLGIRLRPSDIDAIDTFDTYSLSPRETILQGAYREHAADLSMDTEDDVEGSSAEDDELDDQGELEIF